MKIYTKTGDAGETSLFDKTRVSKADPRVDAYGEVDELNATLGAARAAGLDADLAGALETIQKELFAVGARLADPSKRIAGRVTKAAVAESDVAATRTADRSARKRTGAAAEIHPPRRRAAGCAAPHGSNDLPARRATCRWSWSRRCRAHRHRVSQPPVRSAVRDGASGESPRRCCRDRMVNLQAAYAACERDCRAHYENFPVASLLLPRRMRPHVAALYAFARAADDFADEGDSNR